MTGAKWKNGARAGIGKNIAKLLAKFNSRSYADENR